MNSLTERLQKIAYEIKDGESVADIGTDHGYLPMYLYENGISPKLILTDVSRSSLDKARKNLEKAYPGICFDLRQGDGLTVLSFAEVDTIVIAGMGGLLMTGILGYDISKTHSYKRLILQPRNHIGELRFWLYENGFNIINEQLVKEGHYICEILTVINGASESAFNGPKPAPGSIMWEVPENLLKYKLELLKTYLEEKITKEKFILAKQLSATHINEKKVIIQNERIAYLEALGEKL